MDDWPFADPPNVAAITLRSILEGAPILLVTHDEDDGGWQLLDGGDVREEDARVVGLGSMVDRDPTLRELADLALGWTALRARPGAPWRRAPRVPGQRSSR
ncbi:MAG: hypothetical protein AB7N76_18325 [Planctomycetota bacterium]